MNNIRKQIINLIEPYMYKTDTFGYYDLTAVLKYISSLDYYPYPGADISDNFYIALGDKEIEHKREMDGKFFTIPNKPLQIYTEEEEKDLLDLLIKINK